MKYNCRFIQILMSLLVWIIIPSTATAYSVFGGTINLKVGEERDLVTEPSTYYTVSGIWSIEGNVCTITSRSDRKCTISAIRAGEGTIRWSGVIGSADYDYFWYINVSQDSNGGENNSGDGNTPNNNTDIPKYESSWADSYDISWYNKNNDTFILSTNQELAGLAYLVNNGYTTFKGKTIKLGNDIDLTGKNWTTIGLDSSQPFEGSFDGQDHTISGVYVTKQKSKQNNFGFFGVFKGKSILNTIFKGEIDVKNPDFDDYTGDFSIGGIAGFLSSSATIDKCVSAMKIHFSISKSNQHINIGGVCGTAGLSCKIKRCSHIGDISVVDKQKMVGTQSGNSAPLIDIGGILGKGAEVYIERCENISSEILYYASDGSRLKLFNPIEIGGISGNICEVSFCRSIINSICLANESSETELHAYLGGITGGNSASSAITNCYSVINSAKLDKGQLWLSGGGSVYYGGITAERNNYSTTPKANFSNSDCTIDFPNWVTIDKQSGYDGDNSFSSEQMKTNSFLNQLNTYSIIEEGIGIWTTDENGYPCIAETHQLSYSDANNGTEPVVNNGIKIDEANFPDANFRKYLLEQEYGKDGEISEGELKNIRWIDVSASYDSPGVIISLKGIELFPYLSYLFCTNNQLTSLDVTRNTALLSLACSYNQLASLDITHNTALTDLFCHDNQLTSLDVTHNAALTYLDCSYNQLTSLDVTHNTALTDLFCHDNQLTSLDVTHNTALTDLYCSYNQLTSLDVSLNTALKSLHCYENQIKGKAMDDLINGLPTNYSGDEYKLYVVRDPSTDNNICTTDQAAAIKAKGWTPYYLDNGWKEYEGSDPSGIKGVLTDPGKSAPIFDLNGRRLAEPQKGINIIGGKKVVVK